MTDIPEELHAYVTKSHMREHGRLFRTPLKPSRRFHHMYKTMNTHEFIHQFPLSILHFYIYATLQRRTEILLR